MVTKTAVVFLRLLVLLWTAMAGSEFQSMRSLINRDLLKLKDKMSRLHSVRCQPQMQECESRSYNSCQGTAAKQYIETGYFKPEGCWNQGFLKANKSAYRVPVDVLPLTLEQTQSICLTALLEADLSNIFNKHDYPVFSAYFATPDGTFRELPSTLMPYQNDQCKQFQPVRRPWYISAITVPKNVVIMFDQSDSVRMRDGNHFRYIKYAVQEVLNTLSDSDFAAIVGFNSQAKHVGLVEGLQRVTEQKKKHWLKEVSQASPEGPTSFEQPLKKAFDMLQNSNSDQYGGPCSNAPNILILITDGRPNSGDAMSHPELSSIINRKISQTGNDVQLFTYGLPGESLDSALLKNLSESFNGKYFPVEADSEQEIRQKVKLYWNYLISRTNTSEPVMTVPYKDYFEGYSVVSFSIPVYASQNGVRGIVGVAGIDVLLDLIPDKAGLSSALYNSNVHCGQNSLLRNEIPSGNISKCFPTNLTKEVITINQNLDKSTSFCWGMKNSQMYGLIAGSSFGGLAVLVILATVICCRLDLHTKIQLWYSHRKHKANSLRGNQGSSHNQLKPGQNNQEEQGFFLKMHPTKKLPKEILINSVIKDSSNQRRNRYPGFWKPKPPSYRESQFLTRQKRQTSDSDEHQVRIPNTFANGLKYRDVEPSDLFHRKGKLSFQ